MLSDELKGNGTMCWNVPKMKEIMIMLTCYLHKEEKNSVFSTKWQWKKFWQLPGIAVFFRCYLLKYFMQFLYFEKKKSKYFFYSRFELYWLSSSATHLYEENKPLHWLVHLMRFKHGFNILHCHGYRWSQV